MRATTNGQEKIQRISGSRQTTKDIRGVNKLQRP